MSEAEKPTEAGQATPGLAARMARWTRALVLAVVSTVLLWTLFAVLLLSTPQGLEVLSMVAQRATHHALVIGDVSGSLLGGFSANGIRWRGRDGSRVELSRLVFDWSPWALARGTLRLTEVEVDGLRIAAGKSGQADQPRHEPLRLPAGLPFNLRIDAFVLKDAQFAGSSGKPLKLESAKLVGRWFGRDLEIEKLDLNSAETGPVHIAAQATTGNDALDIIGLRLSGPGSLQLHGRVGYGATSSKLTLKLQNFNWPLVGKQVGTTLHDLQGSAKLSGRLLQGQFNFNAALEAQARGRHAALQVQGSGTPQLVKLSKLRLQVDHNGSVKGHGQLQLQPKPAADFDLEVAHFNPKPFAPEWPGDINGEVKIRTEAVSTANAQRIHLTAKLDHSSLRGQPLVVDTAVVATWSKGQWKVDVGRLQARLGTARLQAAGQVTPPFALNGKFSSHDLSKLAPDWAGSLQAEFKLAGTIHKPVLTSSGHAEQLRLGKSLRVDGAKWNVHIDVPSHSRIEARLQGLQVGKRTINTVELQGSGTTPKHQLHLTLNSTRGDVSARLDGGYDLKKRSWSGQLAALTITPTKPAGLAPWHLRAAVPLSVAPGEFKLAKACLDNGAGQLCLSADKAGASTQAKFKLANVQLAAFQALLPSSIKIRGKLDGQGQLQRSPTHLQVHARLEMNSGRVAVKGAPAIELQPSQLLLDNDGQGLKLRVNLHTNRGYVTARLHSAAFDGNIKRFQQAPLEGTAALSLPDIAFLEPMVADRVEHLAGRVDGHVSVSGTVGSPQLAGRMALSDGRASLPLAGTNFTDIGLVLSGHGTAPLDVSGEVTSGKGTVKLSGRVDPRRWPVSVDLQLQGENFQVMNTPDARIAISPTLSVMRGPDGIDLKGTIFVPHAQITPRGGIIEDRGVSVSPDQVIVGQTRKPEAPEPAIHIQLALILGKDVNFEGFGLKTRIAGGVVIRQEPSQPALAQGQFYLEDGHYTAYGQDLTIKTGHLIFDGGPVTQPAIDIVAVRKPRADIQVGVQVRGTLDQPKLSLTSTPEMPQQEKLSWLLFGHGLENGSGGDQSQVAAAALALGLGGGGYIANRIGSKLGIDEVSIGSPTGGGSAVATNARSISGSMAAQGYGTAEASQNAQLTLGKYLTPRLFVSYGVSLFQPGQVFRLLYELGHGFKLQTESGVSNGADLLYTFEAGH